ncbi:MAG: glycoside hydrolase family 2 [Herpetosiphonaceae bacterium]|nr:glycoside hydrolase family 2 [Herpetosiphonaceae bacterium]
MERDENHPRPQLTRERWTDLCGTWQFCYDDANAGLSQHWYHKPEVFDRSITVPFPPESQSSGIHDTSMHPIVWYRRSFQVAPEDRSQRLLLHFGAVDYRAQVWLNGQLVAHHEGGNTPFSADITDALAAGDAEQIIVVRAEDQPQDLTQPRGKQYWEAEPRRIWYHRTTGIWQPVWLEPVGTTYITDIRWTPDLLRGLLGIQIILNSQPDRQLKVDVELSINGTTLANDTYTVERSEVGREIALEPSGMTMSREGILWSPRYPNLIDAVVTLRDGDQVIDVVQSYAGLRSVGFANGRFLLNGRPYYLRLVLEQGYWPDSLLAAPSNEALRHEVEMTKALGFNGVRIHQKVEDPRFLYWCDKLGLLVWGEMANAYVFSSTAVERLAREWIDVVRRDYSHPCIVTWVPLNESWGVPSLDQDRAQQDYVRMVYHLTKTLDPTRPVIGNDGWEHLASDVLGIHDYALDGATIRQRYSSTEALEHTLREVQPHYHTIILPDTVRHGEPIMLTECGGISYAPDPGQPWFGYGTVHNQEEFLAKYEDIMGAILDCPTIVGFCYTQLTDTEQETNGLLHADRTPKLDVAAISAITKRASQSMPGEVLASIQATAEVTSFQGPGR